jgi:phosphoribosylformylglycinamidine synthase
MSQEGSLQSQSTNGQRRWRADVYVTLKPVVNDPQGLAVRDGLHMLGYDEVGAVRAGQYIQVWLEAERESDAEKRMTEMCDKLLANPVIEQYRFNLVEQAHDEAE